MTPGSGEITLLGDSESKGKDSTLPAMAAIAECYQTTWQPQEAESLAGQTATVVHRDGSRKQVILGRDVKLRRERERLSGRPAILRPIVEGHIDAAERAFEPEDEDLILSDGSMFRISFSHGNFFFAIQPLTGWVPVHSSY